MQRIHFMDSLRGTLMVMGIFLHTANIYHVDGNWLISDNTQSPFFNMITDVIHAFRLPAFFIISGYFALYIYRIYGHEKFIIRRITQLSVPLIFSIFSVNILQTIILYYTGTAEFADHPMGWWWGWISKGAWISHLWFLVFLIIYVIIFATCMPYIEKSHNSTTEWLARFLRTRTWLVYIFAPLFFLFLRALGYLAPEVLYRYFAGFSLMDLMHYSYFFALGVLLLRHENMINALVKTPNIVAFIGYLAGMSLIDLIDQNLILFKIAYIYLENLLSIIITFFVWQIYKSCLNREIPFFTELSKSCYTIYLFHHFIVIALGITFMQINLSPYLKFTIISALAMIISFSIHKYIINPSTLLRFLFNGKGYDAK